MVVHANPTPSTQFTPAKALIENVEKIKTGNTKHQVKRRLGKADSQADKEWVYYLDKYSGYVIRFDSNGRVESVNLWVS
jgi:hypothetical protein